MYNATAFLSAAYMQVSGGNTSLSVAFVSSSNKLMFLLEGY
jgi:hypothetical protein